MAEDNVKMLEWHKIDAHIDLPWIDRIRLLFGARLRFRADIGLPWRTRIEVHTSAVIDKVFVWREEEAHEVEPA